MPRMQLNVHYKTQTEPVQQHKCLDIKNRKYLDDSEKKGILRGQRVQKTVCKRKYVEN